MTLRLLPFVPEHRAALEALRLHPGQEHWTRHPRDSLAEAAGDGRRLPVTVLQGETPVGLFVLGQEADRVERFAGAADPAAVTLSALAIDARWQGQGLGGKVLERLPAFVRARFPEARRLLLAVHHSNLPAIRRYRAAGWRVLRSRQGRRERLWILELPLTGTESVQTWGWPAEEETAAELLSQAPAGVAAEVWLTAPAARRRELAARWSAGRGAPVRVYSAYKTLRCFVDERLRPGWAEQPPRELRLEYPGGERGLLEAYPLAAWAREVGAAFSAGPTGERDYTLWVDDEPHAVTPAWHPVTGLDGETDLGLCGAVRFGGPEGELRTFPSAPERCLTALREWLAAQPAAAPARTEVTAEFDVPDHTPEREEDWLSLSEAFAEELYFGLGEFAATRGGAAPGSRTAQPGQVVPTVRAVPGPTRLTVRRVPLLPAPSEAPSPDESPAPAWPRLDRPLSPEEVAASLRALGEPAVAARSTQGRPVPVYLRPGHGPGVLVSGGQHANEATGVAAALLAARRLRSPLPLAFIPLENPDGYALFGELCAHDPRHMHHPARYTALGDDIGHRTAPQHEAAAQDRLRAAQSIRLHLNLHGYPAHEWTRPLSGYVPRHFAAWTLPGGFLLIVRHAPGHAESARALVNAVCGELAGFGELMALNARQLATQAAHASRPHKLVRGTPVIVQEHPQATYPLTLITEFPDETVYGERFRLGVRAQLRAVRAAVRWAEGEWGGED